MSRKSKLIDFDEAGYPFLAEPPAPLLGQLQAQANAEALAYLASTDWYVIRMQKLAPAVSEEIPDCTCLGMLV